MAWIESHQELREHPKTKRLARALGIPLAQAIGHLHMLWWWAMDYAPDGNLSDYDAADIADAAGWEGDSEIFLTALIECGPGGTCGFVDLDEDGMRIHDYDDYGNQYKERKAAADRKRRSREGRVTHASMSQECHAHVTGQSRDTNVTVTGQSRDGHADVTPDKTRQDRTRQDRQDQEDKTARTRERDAAPGQSSSSSSSPLVRSHPTAYPTLWAACEATFGGNYGAFEQLLAYVQDDGMEELAVAYAVQLAVEQGVPTLAYMRGILNRWLHAHVRTLVQAQAREARWRQRKARAEPELAAAREPSDFGHIPEGEARVLTGASLRQALLGDAHG